MKVLVTGCGRGGTNLLTNLVNGFSIVNFTSTIEDRSFFNKPLPNKYATKLSIENKGFNVKSIINKMKQEEDLYILFSIRNPLDNCLSKIRRGQPESLGGDKKTQNISDDATVTKSTDSIKRLYDIINECEIQFPERTLIVKMEDIILNKDIVVDRLSKVFETEHDNIIMTNTKNEYHKKRYGNKIDPSQIDLWKNLKDNFDGFFNNKNTLEMIKKSLPISNKYYNIT
jgi:hypothetical protein